jgi:hypothetical protein
MATLLETVRAATDELDVELVIDQYPWIVQHGLDCIVSPDADGQLCGLLLSNVLGWKVRGFYDGKAMVVDRRVNHRECVFVDVEIFRSGVRSFGNHMLLFNRNRPPERWEIEFEHCFSMNNWRGHDRRAFRRKYPFASIHFLMVILAARHAINPPPSAAGPLLFADGTYKLLLQYTENAWDWMRYLGVADDANPLHALFHNPDLSVYELMTKMLDFWEQRDRLSETGHRGDRIAITERGGAGRTINLEPSGTDGLWCYATAAKDRIEGFITMMGQLTGWEYDARKWSWDEWELFEFEKGINTETRNIPAFNGIIGSSPLSWALTGQNQCEYTLDPQGIF